jgi:hypothetical protein
MRTNTGDPRAGPKRPAPGGTGVTWWVCPSSPGDPAGPADVAAPTLPSAAAAAAAGTPGLLLLMMTSAHGAAIGDVPPPAGSGRPARKRMGTAKGATGWMGHPMRGVTAGVTPSDASPPPGDVPPRLMGVTATWVCAPGAANAALLGLNACCCRDTAAAAAADGGGGGVMAARGKETPPPPPPPPAAAAAAVGRTGERCMCMGGAASPALLAVVRGARGPAVKGAMVSCTGGGPPSPPAAAAAAAVPEGNGTPASTPVASGAMCSCMGPSAGVMWPPVATPPAPPPPQTAQPSSQCHVLCPTPTSA